MRKQIIVISLIFTLVLLTGCCKEHIWLEATCTQPPTCSECGKTEGDIISHSFLPPTCTIPATCSMCGLTEGGTIPHTWQDATCLSPKKCSICGETDGVASSVHAWVEATCTDPKTCSICGTFTGSALGHKDGEWQVVESDMVKATEVLKKYCYVCKDQLDRKERDMDSLHDSYRFLITPKEFTKRLNNIFNSYADNNLTAASGSSGGYYACGILTLDTADKAGVLLFVGDGTSVSEYQKNDICFDGALGSVDGDENIASLMLALIETCDPTVSLSEAKSIASKVLNNQDHTYNGITYMFYYNSKDGSAIIGFSLDSD